MTYNPKLWVIVKMVSFFIGFKSCLSELKGMGLFAFNLSDVNKWRFFMRKFCFFQKDLVPSCYPVKINYV